MELSASFKRRQGMSKMSVPLPSVLGQLRFLSMLVVVLVAACGVQPANPAILSATATAAEDGPIKAAAAAFKLSDPFPRHSGSKSCAIVGGGPYPGIRVSGKCSTVAVRSYAGPWIVTFTEKWDARAFHSIGDPVNGELTYSWVFAVTDAGQATFLRGQGNLPPQLAF
jgi:hypothetical protein